MRAAHELFLVLMLRLAVSHASEAQNKDRNWLTYYSGAEANEKKSSQWTRDIWPRIAHAADMSRTLEIAPGAGRITERLLGVMPAGSKLFGVEKNRVAVETLLRKRFAAFSETNASSPRHATFYVNNGSSLAPIPDGSITFAISWDSMVHFAPEDVAAYVLEIARVLAPGGTGFLHHSNLPQCKGNAARGRARGADRSCGVPVKARKNPHGRNLMTCDIFAKLATAAGLQMIRSEKFLWPPEPEKHTPKQADLISDCLSSFRKPVRSRGR
jgi:SAM-dependent methyltransferase